jgi:hypothetical protein
MDYTVTREIRNMAQDLCDENGYESFAELTADDIAYIGDEADFDYVEICDILVIDLPEGLENLIKD